MDELILELITRTDSLKINGLYTAFIREANGGFVFSGETHDFWEMMYCIDGSAVVSMGNKVITLTENQIIFFQPMEFHSFRVEKGVNSRFFIVTFTAEGKLTDTFRSSMFNLNSENKHLLFEIIKQFDFEDAIASVGNEVICLKKIAEHPNKLNVLFNMLENFLTLLSDAAAVPKQFVKTNDAILYTTALKIIDDCVYEKMTVEQLAQKCHISAAYLKKLFKKYNGLGVHEYILKNKIALVKQLLIDGQSVTEIAEKLAFASQNYLSTSFKRETGLTPMEYRNRLSP